MRLLHRQSIDQLATSYVETLERVKAEQFDRVMISAGPILANPLVPEHLRQRAIAALDEMADRCIAVVARARLAKGR